MAITSVEELNQFMDRYEEVLFSREPDLDSLTMDPQAFEETLLSYISVWENSVGHLAELVPRITKQMFIDREFTPLISEIATEFESLVDEFEQVKGLLGPVTLEDAHSSLMSGMRQSLSCVDDILRQFATRYEPYVVPSAMFPLIEQPFLTEGSKISKVKNLVAQGKIRKLTKETKKSEHRQTWFDRVFSSNNQVWLLSSAFFTTVLLAIAQLPALDSLSDRKWLRVGMLSLAGLYLAIRVIRIPKAHQKRRLLAHFVSTILLVGTVALWAFNWVGEVVHYLSQAEILLKLFIGWVTILWFPMQFLNVFNYKATRPFFYGIFWAGLASLWVYGLIKGVIVTSFLTWPMFRLINISKNEQRELPQKLGTRFYIPLIISFLLVALLLTHEPFWLIDLAVWVMFVWVVRLSFRYFRRSYDLIEELYPDTQGDKRKNRFLLISLVLSTLLVTPGLLGKLDYEFVTSIYLQAGGLAFSLITILLAVQAIIPGVTTWSGEDNLSRRSREMRSILRANAGLEGFMQLFFILFVYSLVGWLITTRLFSNLTTVVDFSVEFQLNPRINVFAVFSSGPQIIFSESILIGLSTVFFAGFVSIAIYSISQLYYLFIAANTLILPIRDALLSTPVQIEKSWTYIDGNIDQKHPESLGKVIGRLRANRRLNGHIIDSLRLNVNDGQSEVILELEMDFVEISELFSIVREVYRTLFNDRELQRAKLIIFQNTHWGGSRRNVFILNISRRQWVEFLSKDIDGFPFQYKLERLGATILDYVAAESKLA